MSGLTSLLFDFGLDARQQSLALNLFSEKPSLLDSLSPQSLAKIATICKQPMSSTDEGAIVDILGPELENRQPLIDYRELLDGHAVDPLSIVQSVDSDTADRYVLAALQNAIAAHHALLLPLVDSRDARAAEQLQAYAAHAATLISSGVVNAVFLPHRTATGHFTLVHYTRGTDGRLATHLRQRLPNAAALYRQALVTVGGKEISGQVSDASVAALAMISVDPVAEKYITPTINVAPAAAGAASAARRLAPLNLAPTTQHRATLRVNANQISAQATHGSLNDLASILTPREDLRPNIQKALKIATEMMRPDPESTDAGVTEAKASEDDVIAEQRKSVDFFARQKQQFQKDQVVAQALQAGFEPTRGNCDLYNEASVFLDAQVVTPSRPRLRR